MFAGVVYVLCAGTEAELSGACSEWLWLDCVGDWLSGSEGLAE